MTPQGKSTVQSPDTRAAAVACARIAEGQKARDIVLFDVSEILVVTQFFLVCTCDSAPQLRAVIEEVAAHCKAAGLKKLGREIDADVSWGLLDYGDLVAHVFQTEARSYYALEDLWSDAPRIAWEPEGGAAD